MDALKIYRIANHLYKYHVPLLPKVLQGIIFLLFNSYIPYQTKIGKGTRLGHRGIGVVINKEAIIGNNVLIRAHVTIGKKSSDGGAPIIGDQVMIGDGAKILGDISIGDGSVIGANAVVARDVPEKKVVGGVPAVVIGDVS